MSLIRKLELRSDTFTKPGKGMMQAMMSASVGDDVFSEDPTVNELEGYAAELFGMQEAVFCPSGTMTNQIAIKVNTRPMDEVICDKLSHIYLYEAGGIAYNSGASVRLLDGDRGRINATQVIENINANETYYPKSALVALENTVNKGGGAYYNMQDILDIKKVCEDHGLRLHLDGARLFNALVETKESPKDFGKIFDTISICLSKGLGAPVGSLLLLKHKQDKEAARRTRKVMGGGMRQSGFLAAAGLYALKNNVDLLLEDHKRARLIGETLKTVPGVSQVLPVDTNIVIFELEAPLLGSEIVKKLVEFDILCAPFGKRMVRMVTHLDFTDDDLNETIKRLSKLDFRKI